MTGRRRAGAHETENARHLVRQTLRELGPEERLITAAAESAARSGAEKAKIRFNDRRLLIIYVLVIVGFIATAQVVNYGFNKYKHRADAAQTRTDFNCRQFGGALDVFNDYLDQQIKNTEARTDLSPVAKQAAIDNAKAHRSKPVDCGPLPRVDLAPNVPTVGVRQYPYHPFEGPNDAVDGFRLIFLTTSAWLLLVIGRVVKEGRRRGGMGWKQIRRFAGLALYAAGTAYGVAQRFGVPLNTSLALTFAGAAVSWWGVLGMRSEQKRNPSP